MDPKFQKSEDKLIKRVKHLTGMSVDQIRAMQKGQKEERRSGELEQTLDRIEKQTKDNLRLEKDLKDLRNLGRAVQYHLEGDKETHDNLPAPLKTKLKSMFDFLEKL